jgi:RNA polymerase sigma factor (sigma-70 family)
VSSDAGIEPTLRRLAPQVLAALVRRYGRFDACEDAMQEALLAATTQWRRDGIPDNPRGWLIAVGSRRLIDELRSEQARKRREDASFEPSLPFEPPAAGTAAEQPPQHDETLQLLFLCCHPALRPASQIALTLRAVGGLTTAEIANAFLVPEATMAQRISRAKQTIKASGIAFQMPPKQERADRLRVVLHVLYLIFNEGYTATAGPTLQRLELAEEAIRITRTLHRLLPDEGEATGLLALMLLTHARRAARTSPDGSLVPLAEQDRSVWDAAAIAEGAALIARALAGTPLGPYQLQAAIAAVHAEATSAEVTDWRQVLALYELLERIAPSPVVTLNRAVALSMVRGPRAGLELLAEIEGNRLVASHHRLEAVRAHLHELAGDTAAAEASYRRAARLTQSLPERRFLEARAARSRTGSDVESPPSGST